MNRRAFLTTLLAVGLGAFAGIAQLGAAGADAGDQVREAIQRQRVMKVSYGGFERLVEPHAVGTSVGGHRAVLVWQIEGGSKSDPPTGWRTFLIADLRQVTVTVRGFTPRPSYRREKSPLRTLEFDVFGRAQDVVPPSGE